MIKQLNKQIKATIKAIANAGTAEESVLYSQVLVNLMQAKQTAGYIRLNQ